jgi:subtilisin family serine protease
MNRTSAAPFWTALGSILILIVVGPVSPPRAATGPLVPKTVRDRVAREGRARVIVELNLRSGRYTPEGGVSRLEAAAQRVEIRGAASRVISKLRPGERSVVRRFDTVPYVALEIDDAGASDLERAGADVVQVMDDPILRPVLAESVPLIQGDQVWAAGHRGLGVTVAVVDSGVDSAHPFLAGRVVEEACYSSNVAGLSHSVCPNGLSVQTGPGSAAPCSLPDCVHGTHVAGIAAGSGATAGVSFSGVAPAADIMAVQVFSEITSASSCGGIAPCLGAFASDIIAGLERVHTVAPQLNIVAANMSLGGSTFAAPCDAQPYKPAIDNLRSIGVATVVAAGNSAATAGVSTPACVSSAVSVGSTDKSNQVSWFSNVASFLSLFAPGEAITSSVPGGAFAAFNGTSMAAPHVTGAWALLKEVAPSASVGTILNALRQTGLSITDTRVGGTATISRVSIFAALAALAPVENPEPVVTAMSPTKGRSGMGALTLTLTGSGFDGFSVVRWNGGDRPTTVVNTGTIRAAISDADLAAVGTAQVTVFTPSPGGGTSAPQTFTIDPPAVLTPGSSTVAPGATVTVTLVNGFGGAQDWIALAAANAPNTSYIAWTYVGPNTTSRTWSVAMPTTGGAYEFRLFLDNGYTRGATSPPVTVDPALTPPPIATSLSPIRAFVGGPAFTLTVTGNAFVPWSVVLWNGVARPTTFVSTTQIRAAIAAADIASTGVAQIAVRTPAPGGGISVALPLSIDPPPILTPSATTVAAGAAISVTLSGGAGGPTDWLSLAPVGAPEVGGAVQWIYVGANVTNRTWTVAAPLTTGTYEFRLYLNNGYVRAATSASFTVTAAIPPVLNVSATTAAGGAPVTVTLADGRGGATDWLALAAVGAPDGSYLQWTYVGAGVTTRTWTVTMPSAGGVFEFRLYLNGGYVRAATSPPITVAAVTPALTVNNTTVAVGGSVTVTLTGGAGGSTDWLALAAVGAANTSFLQWTYVGVGVTTRTWTVTLPITTGAYEFRLFLNNGYSRAATSPTVTTTSP